MRDRDQEIDKKIKKDTEVLGNCIQNELVKTLSSISLFS